MRTTTATSETIRIGPLGIRFLIEGKDSNGGAAVFECTIPAGAAVPAPHSHDAYEETVYGLEGVLTWTVDGRATDLGPGDALCIPRGAVHKFENLGDEDVKVLSIVTPGILGPDYFREVAAVIDAAAGGPPDRAAVGEIMLRHGLTPAAPPTS
jgi:quercetin dioxygenase-like cupin family protein